MGAAWIGWQIEKLKVKVKEWGYTTVSVFVWDCVAVVLCFFVLWELLK